MKFKVHITNLSAGGPLIAIMNYKDAMAMGIIAKSRATMAKNNKTASAIIDISYGNSIKQGEIWLFSELAEELKAKNNSIVNAVPQNKLDSQDYIKKKMDKNELTKEEIHEIISDLTNNKLTEIETTAFVSACYINGMTLAESAHLAEAIVESSGRLHFKKRIIIDKHCIGGIAGNRTTMIVVPIIAAAGLTIPKSSSRAITSPAGTADTMEVLAPVSHSKEKIMQIVNKTNGCMVWGGALSLASADDKIIKFEKPLNLDPEGILLASIMSKKSAADATHVLIDIPVGAETKITSIKEAKHLKKLFIKLGKKMRINTDVIITNAVQPIGNGIGPALEAIDILKVLKGNGPVDLRRKSLVLASKMLKLAGVRKPMKTAVRILKFGLADKKMREIIKAQGGNPNIQPKDIEVGPCKYTRKSSREGMITKVSNHSVKAVAKLAGAPTDKSAGIYLHKKLRNYVKKGEELYTIYAKTKEKLEYAKELSKKEKIMEVS